MLSNSGLSRASAHSKRGRHDRCRSSAILSQREHPHREVLIPATDLRRAKSLPALLADAPDERAVVTIDGRRRKIAKREAIVAQMVDKSASADLRATKMLIDMM
jgi:uncharacterized protein DUF5681